MEQPPSVTMGSPFLPAQGSPSLIPGLSILYLTARRHSSWASHVTNPAVTGATTSILPTVT